MCPDLNNHNLWITHLRKEMVSYFKKIISAATSPGKESNHQSASLGVQQNALCTLSLFITQSRKACPERKGLMDENILI